MDDTKPNIIACTDPQDVAVRAAQYFGTVLKETIEREGREPVIVLPAGMTPLPFYEELVRRYTHERATDLNRFVYIQLDEYLGLPNVDKRLFSRWLGATVLDPLSVPIERRVVFKSDTPDVEAEIKRMEGRIAEFGGLDLAVLGLGANGHIGFNEPGSSFDSGIRTVKLTKETQETNAAYWDSHPPEDAITLGLGTLREARQTLLLVTGGHKAEALKKTLQGPVTPDMPASYLQQQQNVIVIADMDALSAL